MVHRVVSQGVGACCCGSIRASQRRRHDHLWRSAGKGLYRRDTLCIAAWH